MYSIMKYIFIGQNCVWGFKCKTSLTWDGCHYWKAWTSLHSAPMLKTDCPISHKPLASPFPQAGPLFQPHIPHMWHIFTKGRWHWHIGCLLHQLQILNSSFKIKQQPIDLRTIIGSSSNYALSIGPPMTTNLVKQSIFKKYQISTFLNPGI